MTEEQLKAFIAFKNKLITACQKDARLEYTDKGHVSAVMAWKDADEAEKHFRSLFNV